MKNIITIVLLLVSFVGISQGINLNPNNPTPNIVMPVIKTLEVYELTSLKSSNYLYFFQTLKAKEDLSIIEDASFVALRAYRQKIKTSPTSTVTIKVDKATIQKMVDELPNIEQQILQLQKFIERKEEIEYFVNQLKKQEEKAGVSVAGSALIPKK